MDPVVAVCTISQSSEGIMGHILFTETKTGSVIVQCHLSGFKHKNTKRGFHVHENGDLRFDDAEGCCAHFNPYESPHGGRIRRGRYQVLSKNRHVGDLGNINVDARGKCNDTFEDSLIALRGKRNIIGRSIVIHRYEDDLGETEHPLSSTTGNSGPRVAAGVIGYAATCM